MAIELVPLCTMRLQSKPAVQVGTGPAGTRLIVDCLSVEVKGDRLSGQMEGRTTGDERYAWLNKIQAVGKGTINEDLSVDYEWYEIR
jgi:hypothetical protein